MEYKNFLFGGKIGDFIHGLVICKYLYDFKNIKANIFLTENSNNINECFETSLKQTYTELSPILLKQDWVNGFYLYNNDKIHYDVTNFRSSSFLYKTSWSNIFLKTYLNIDSCPQNYKWIELHKQPELQNVLLVNRKPDNMSKENEQYYLDIIKNYEFKKFIFFSKQQYDSFPLKEHIEPLQCNTLYDFFVAINSCKHFLSNQTGPFAWATALNVPRTLELKPTIDSEHYRFDHKIYSEFSCF